MVAREDPGGGIYRAMEEIGIAILNNKVKPEHNDVKQKGHKPTYPGFIKNLRCYVVEYCQATSLHGLKFLGEQQRSIVEKIWWLAIVAISLYFCTNLMLKTYSKWQQSPVIVNFATSQTPIWQIPFPAVTICPETKSEHEKFSFADIHQKRIFHNATLEESRLYEYMALVCVSEQKMTYKYVNDTMLDFIARVAPSLENVMWNCKWMGTNESCNELFVPIITDVGVCYSFNILNHTEMFANDVYQHKNFQSTNKSQGWSLEDGYSEDDDAMSYPQRALFSGAKAGLSLNLETVKADKDFLCTGGMQGYKIHLHHPADIPSVDENYFRVSLDEAVIVAVKPSVMTTNEKLYSYSYLNRHCYFQEEKPLRFFKIYSQQNCYVECLTKFTLKTCKCVAFHMPRVDSTRICGPAKKTCVMVAETLFLTEEVNTNIKKLAKYALRNKSYETCDCLPACNSTNYDGEISQTHWNWQKYYDSEELRNKIRKQPIHNSKLIVFFKDRQIMTSERNELYGPTDFIANCGGLLGLFIGFSVISLMELFYFLTLRFICNLRKFGRHYWSGDEELIKNS